MSLLRNNLGKSYTRSPIQTGVFSEAPQPQAHTFGGIGEKFRKQNTQKTLSTRPLDKSPGSPLQRTEVKEGIKKRLSVQKQQATKAKTLSGRNLRSVGGGGGGGRLPSLISTRKLIP